MIPFRVFLEHLPDIRRGIIVNDNIAALRDALVAQGRGPDPLAALCFLDHAAPAPCRAHVVIKLGEDSEHAFHRASYGRVVDIFRHRTQLGAVSLEKRLRNGMIGLIAGEAVDLVHYEKIDRALFIAAEGKRFLEFRAVGSLRRLALFDIDVEDLYALALRILLAEPLLHRKARALHLLGRRHAAVDDARLLTCRFPCLNFIALFLRRE